jgi:hypothetical protein
MKSKRDPMKEQKRLTQKENRPTLIRIPDPPLFPAQASKETHERAKEPLLQRRKTDLRLIAYLIYPTFQQDVTGQPANKADTQTRPNERAKET